MQSGAVAIKTSTTDLRKRNPSTAIVAPSKLQWITPVEPGQNGNPSTRVLNSNVEPLSTHKLGSLGKITLVILCVIYDLG